MTEDAQIKALTTIVGYLEGIEAALKAVSGTERDELATLVERRTARTLRAYRPTRPGRNGRRGKVGG